MNDKIDEYETLLREARQVLDDWSDEYGHLELELMRDKIDAFLDKQHLTSLLQPTPRARLSSTLGENMDFELVMNKAIDKLSLLTKEDFHGYRSEIWAVLAEVYRAGQQTDPVDTRRCLLWSGCQLKLTEGGCLTGCVKRQ